MLSLDWIVGFLEGEGSPHFHTNKNKLYPRFNIANTDKDILEKIKLFFGFGSIEFIPDKRPNRKQGWQYVVSNCEDCLRLVERIWFKLKSETKRNQFRIWLEGFNVYTMTKKRNCWLKTLNKLGLEP